VESLPIPISLYPYTNTNTLSLKHTHPIPEIRKMPLRDGAAIRRERLQMIIEIVRRNPDIRIAKLQVVMAMRTGLTKKRVSEYAQELVEGERLLVDDNGQFKVA